MTATHDLADDNAANDSAAAVVTVNAAPVTDIAITSVGAPTSTNEGDLEAVTVTVDNVGNQDVTNLSVSLTPTAGAVTVSPQVIALTAGASTILNFTWDTGGASIQNHTLTATHDLADDNAANDSAAAVVTVNAAPPPPTMVDNLTDADFSTPEGSISGSHVDTHVSDNLYEALTEGQQGKKNNARSSLTHTWTFSVPAGTAQTFSVEAHHTLNSEGDNFVFAYSTDNASFTDMVVVSKTADDDTAQLFALPDTLVGTLFVRVVDSDNSKGNNVLDTLLVDSTFVTTTIAGGGNTAPIVTITAPAGGSAFDEGV